MTDGKITFVLNDGEEVTLSKANFDEIAGMINTYMDVLREEKIREYAGMDSLGSEHIEQVTNAGWRERPDPTRNATADAINTLAEEVRRLVGRTKTKGDILLSGLEADILRSYLLSHEVAIGNEENDFGSLYLIFLTVFKRNPRKA